MSKIMWQFSTRQFDIIATIESSCNPDLSWDDDGETRARLESGEWQAFDTIVRGYCKGREIGWDALCESIYADPRDFFTAHRDADPMNRNCSVMRAAKGEKVCICHYFPDMVREAISAARKTLCNMPRVRC